MMLPKESIVWINSIESDEDLLRGGAFGVDFWPIVRNTVLSQVFSREVTNTKKNKSGFSFGKVFRSLFSLIGVKRSDRFFLSDLKFCQSVDGVQYLKDLDQISMDVSKSDRTTVGLLNPDVDDWRVRERSLSLYGLVLICLAISKLVCKFGAARRIRLYVDSAIGIIQRSEHAPLLDYSKLRRSVTQNLIFCLVAKLFLSALLNRMRVRECYIHCYYSLVGMALCAACKELSVRSIDVQHGVSGRFMRAYGSWSNVPLRGYSTMPDEFLVWTKYDARAIKEWALNDQSASIYPDIGSPWHKYVMQSGLLAKAEDEFISFLEELKQFSNCCIITTQGKTLNPLLLELIKASSQDTCFLIRLHPDITNLESISDEDDLESRFANVFVKQPSLMPIQLSMSIADVNLTEWSASVYDAYFCDVKSIVVSNNGRDYFDDFISDGLVFYEDSIAGLKSRLDELLAKNDKKK